MILKILEYKLNNAPIESWLYDGFTKIHITPQEVIGDNKVATLFKKHPTSDLMMLEGLETSSSLYAYNEVRGTKEDGYEWSALVSADNSIFILNENGKTIDRF